jgi:nucleoside-diphosphate-sugar epimerase
MKTVYKKISLNKLKILIVGGAGFVGSNLSHYLLREYNLREIWIVDNLLSSEKANLPIDPAVRFIQGSIADDYILGQLPKDLDIVFHLACYHGNQSSIANPIADHDNNTLTTLKLLEFLKDFKKIRKVVYAAAGCTFSEKTFNTPKPTFEDQPATLFHDSPYSISKLIGEMYGNYYWRYYKLPFVKARFQNVYGPREILGAGRWRGTVHTIWRNVVPTFIWKSLQGEKLPLHNSGKVSRDFIYVEDVVRGLVACAEKGKAGEAYNLASGVETTIFNLAKIINKITGNKKSVDLKTVRDWDRSGRRYGSTKKAKNKINFVVSVSLEEGLKKTIEWTQNNKKIIKKTIRKHHLILKKILNKNTI